MGGIFLFPSYGSNSKQSTIFTLCNIASVIFFELLVLVFSYMLLYFYYLDVAIFEDVMNFEINLFCKVSTSIYWFTNFYPLCSYINQLH